MKPFDVYLAAPYSDPDPAVVEFRVHEINLAAGWLMRQGMRVFSPISMSHPIAMTSSLPTDWAFWKAFDEAIIPACERMLILGIAGFSQSVGVKAEAFIAWSNIPIRMLIPFEGGYIEQEPSQDFMRLVRDAEYRHLVNAKEDGE